LRVKPHDVRFGGDLAAGDLVPGDLQARDWLRICELVAAYRDLPLGTVDAFRVAAFERRGAHVIATIDRRLRFVRPVQTDTFDLVS